MTKRKSDNELQRARKMTKDDKEAFMRSLLSDEPERDDVQERLLEWLATNYTPELIAFERDDEHMEQEQLKKEYDRCKAQVMLLLKTPSAIAMPHVYHTWFRTSLLLPRAFACYKDQPYDYIKIEIDSAFHEHANNLLKHCVENDTEHALLFAMLCYDLSSRPGLLSPGHVRMGHKNQITDFAFNGERARVMFPDKQKIDEFPVPYNKVHILDATLAEKGMTLLYQHAEANPGFVKGLNNRAKEALQARGLLQYIKCDKEFQLRHLREISLTMFPFVWDTTAIDKDNPIFAQSIQAHHLSANTTRIYTQCTVTGTVAPKGRLLNESFDVEPKKKRVYKKKHAAPITNADT